MMILDELDNIYISGPTRSANFPISTNAIDSSYNGTSDDGDYGDIFITKVSKNGDSLLYSSFIGGEDEETIYGIDVNDEWNK